jgi:purine-binding chemotaxis protein CheW
MSRDLQHLTFAVGDEEYGVGIRQAKEIIEYDVITTVPHAPRWVRGVINLRGNVVPVVDLAVRFGRTPAPRTRKSCIVIVEVRREGGVLLVGIIADGVTEVVELPEDAIEPPPALGTRGRHEWLTGLGRSGRGFVLLIDTDRLLGDLEPAGEEPTDASAGDLLPAGVPAGIA